MSAVLFAEVDRLRAANARLREAITEIRDRLAGHPVYEALTEAQEMAVGGDAAEFSYLVRVADIALGDKP